MLAVIPDRLLLVQQAEIKLVNQGRRLEKIGIALAAKIGRGDFPKVGLNKRHQLLKG